MITIMLDFVGWQFAGDELTELENDVTELESLRVELASYFCEDVKTFQLDECIRLFSTFFDSFIRASQVHTHTAVFAHSLYCVYLSQGRDCDRHQLLNWLCRACHDPRSATAPLLSPRGAHGTVCLTHCTDCHHWNNSRNF